MTPMETSQVAWCEGELKLLGLTRYAGDPARQISYQGKAANVDVIAAARERERGIGGKRVTLNSWSEEKDREDDSGDVAGRQSDHKSRDYRGEYRDKKELNDNAKHVVKTIAACLHCGKSFEKTGRVWKFCSDNCRKRHWEQTKENLCQENLCQENLCQQLTENPSKEYLCNDKL
jgi:hypothetical protein